MKTTHSLQIVACAVAMTVFSAAGLAMADEVVVHHDAWTHDNTGYWDAHSVHHAYIYHDNHHGYWREDNGTRVFINID
jgi:hypothetical protein